MRRPIVILSAAALAVGLLTPTGAATAATPPGYTVTVTVKSTKEPVAADWISLAGSTSKRLSGEKLRLQRRVGTAEWATVGSLRVKADGTYTTKTRATGVGKQSYRVQVPATKKHRSSSSKAAGVTVFRYYPLRDLTPVAEGGLRNAARTQQIGGTVYSQTTVLAPWWATAWAEFNASFRCRSFTAIVGTLDTVGVDYASRSRLLLDGTELVVTDNLPGKSTAVSADVRGGFRIRIESSFTKTRSGQYVGWGDAQLLCSGKP